ncbi:MAG: SdpI family protein [Massiliimalia sp.]|jgi:uncharacterized membrane protein
MNRQGKITAMHCVYWGLALFPMILSLALYSRLPAEMVTHWGINNEPNGYSSKEFACFGIPAVLFLLTIIVNVAIKIDPKSENINRSQEMKLLGRWFIVVVSNVTQGMILALNLGHSINVGFWITLMVGILFTLMGNYMPKCKFNYTMGIRTPWTLADEEIWVKTHRFGGRLWTICGVLLILCGIFSLNVLFFLVIAAMALVPIVYSYYLYHQKKNT